MQPDIELRCENGQLLGVLKGDTGLLEIQCKNRRCKNGMEVTVFHYIDPLTGIMKDTKRFADPAERLRK